MKKYMLNYSSPWAFLTCFNVLSVILSILLAMKLINFISGVSKSLWINFWCSMMILMSIAILWFRDCSRESLIGSLSDDKSCNIKVGMILFLLSEAFLFFSFFWMFTSSVLVPDLSFWPPSSLKMPSFIGAPSLNTILLVASSATVTLSHFEKDIEYPLSKLWLMMTLVLSSLFMIIQYMEYTSLPFSFTSGVGGSIFYLATGFHGIHVILGSSLLFGCLILISNNYYTKDSLLSYEMIIWYWHFVDAIWLMLYTVFYCWGH
uniref:Cytochrome c oxidase subunit 3 n=1 Tax=Trichuris sp. LO613 TaxID=2856030 RepID=A0A8F5DQC9_9BILA|nr:cytochrome oxidase subunit 3 [Trichuris sp. LO613]